MIFKKNQALHRHRNLHIFFNVYIISILPIPWRYYEGADEDFMKLFFLSTNLFLFFIQCSIFNVELFFLFQFLILLCFIMTNQWTSRYLSFWGLIPKNPWYRFFVSLRMTQFLILKYDNKEKILFFPAREDELFEPELVVVLTKIP